MAKQKKQPDAQAVTMQAKCVLGHKFTLSQEDIGVARSLGCAMCPQCGNPAFVTQIGMAPKKGNQRA